jgi:hypothetical protein
VNDMRAVAISRVLRARLSAGRREPEAGYSTQLVLVPALSILVAVAILAFLVVPAVHRLLDGW